MLPRRDATADAMTDAGAVDAQCRLRMTQTDNARLRKLRVTSAGPKRSAANGTCGLTCGALRRPARPTAARPTARTPEPTTPTAARAGTRAARARSAAEGPATRRAADTSSTAAALASTARATPTTYCGAGRRAARAATPACKCATGKSVRVGFVRLRQQDDLCSGVCVDTTTDSEQLRRMRKRLSGASASTADARPAARNILALSSEHAPSGTYLVDPDGIGPGAAYSAYCDMTHNGGGWTLALKADGANPASSFTYGSALWTNAATLNVSSVDLSMTEAKFQSFSQIVASSVLLEDRWPDTTANADTPPTNSAGHRAAVAPRRLLQPGQRLVHADRARPIGVDVARRQRGAAAQLQPRGLQRLLQPAVRACAHRPRRQRAKRLQHARFGGRLRRRVRTEQRMLRDGPFVRGRTSVSGGSCSASTTGPTRRSLREYVFVR